MTLIDGKAIAQKTHAATKAAVAALQARGFTTGLAVVLVGDRATAQDLLMTFPPLLEMLATL